MSPTFAQLCELIQVPDSLDVPWLLFPAASLHRAPATSERGSMHQQSRSGTFGPGHRDREKIMAADQRCQAETPTACDSSSAGCLIGSGTHRSRDGLDNRGSPKSRVRDGDPPFLFFIYIILFLFLAPFPSVYFPLAASRSPSITVPFPSPHCLFLQPRGMRPHTPAPRCRLERFGLVDGLIVDFSVTSGQTSTAAAQGKQAYQTAGR